MIVWNLYFLIVVAYWMNSSTWRLSVSFEKLANICKDALTIRGTSLPSTFVNFVNSPLVKENLSTIIVYGHEKPSLSSSMKLFNGGVLHRRNYNRVSSLPQLASLRCYASSNPFSWVCDFDGKSDSSSQYQMSKTKVFLLLIILFWKYELIGLWSSVLLSILIFVQILGAIHLLENVNNGFYST